MKLIHRSSQKQKVSQVDIVLDGCCPSSTRPSWALAVIYIHIWSNLIQYMLRLYCSLAVPMPAVWLSACFALIRQHIVYYTYYQQNEDRMAEAKVMH